MRTTIIIDDKIGTMLKKIVPKKKLSEFINCCLLEHFEAEEKVRRIRELEAAYQRAGGKKTVSGDFDVVEREDWPEW